MNGAAVNRQQEQPLHPQNNDSSSLHSPGYLLQTNYHCQEKNPQHQYSKEMNYKLLPDNFSVDGSSKHSQYIDSYCSEPRNRLSNSGDILDCRINPTRIIVREPMELPVPEFEIDENSVGVFTYKKNTSSSVQDSTDLDLDTRINLLIKSKALSGMHPIFSDLNESEDSSTDSEEFYSDSSKRKPMKNFEVLLPEKRLHQESFDDPEKPLSRPPSPFLSRATYLFWFNKAIELKQQAKAQEQALLEKATKMLGQGNLSNSAKVSKTSCSKQDSNLLKSLLSEVGRELKESIKQDFIKTIIENTVLNSLEDWWAKERNLEENNFSKDFSMVSSTTNDSLQSKDGKETDEYTKLQANTDNKICQGQKSTSPKVLFPSSENKNQNAKEKLNTLENQVTSIIEFNKTLVKEPDKDVLKGLTAENGSVIYRENDYVETKNLNTNHAVDSSSFRVKESDLDVVEGLTAEHGSVICKENDNLGTESSNENCTVDSSTFRESSPINLGEIERNNSLNDRDDTLDIRNTYASENEILKDKFYEHLRQDEKDELNVQVITEESNNSQHSPVIRNLPVHGKLVVESLIENILVKMEGAESSENSVIKTVKSFDKLDNLEENRFNSKGSSLEKNNKEESCLQNLINNKENNTEINKEDNQ